MGKKRYRPKWFPDRLGFATIGYATVLRVDGLRVVIYPNDHPPAHVHVLGPGWVVIDLRKQEVREAIGCDEREARRALRLIEDHRGTLMDAWRRFHG